MEHLTEGGGGRVRAPYGGGGGGGGLNNCGPVLPIPKQEDGAVTEGSWGSNVRRLRQLQKVYGAAIKVAWWCNRAECIEEHGAVTEVHWAVTEGARFSIRSCIRQ